ncbi:restriction endonuclease [Gilvimarinus agarilyticus]|nr:restriction endonuclease [Gilvimarinus agarilyticus]
MNDGKKLEKLVRLVQEALKNMPSTEIFSNYKIENVSGRKREIDIFIKSQINGMDIKIAIECKDYKKAIPAEKLEAFNSKCQRIKGISKKVFVSSSGYQADAFEAAKYFDIELFNLNEMSNQQVTEWFPIKQLNANIKLQLPLILQIQATEDEIKKMPDKELTVYYYEDIAPIIMTGFVWNAVVVPEQKTIQNYMLLDFMKGNCRKEEDKYTRMPFVLNVEGVYILGENNKKINLNRIESEIVGWYDDLPAQIIEAKSYEKVDTNPDATVVSFDVGKEERVEIVKTQNNDLSFFCTMKDGRTFKMKTLVSYDSKTDVLKRVKKDENEG